MDGWHHEGKIDWKGKIGWIRCKVEREEKKNLAKGALFDFFYIFFGSREMMMTISFPLQCPALILLLCSKGSLFEKKRIYYM